MFYLHTSNKTENLIRQLAAVIAADPLDSLFDKECLLVQSQGMERMLCQDMARIFTVWANYRFLLPLSFFQEIAVAAGLSFDAGGYERATLTWRIDLLVRDISEECYGQLRHYLQDGSSLKRFQLARQVANLFDQYQLMRPAMLSAWDNGKSVGEDPAENWQRHLWQRLSQDGFEGLHRGEMFASLIKALQGDTLPGPFPKRVSVFGLHVMPPVFLSCLEALSHHCDVQLFLLNPCRYYWGDMKRSSLQGVAGDDGLPLHPLLASCGEQGREFQDMLQDVTCQGTFASFQACENEDGELTVLQKLQNDLLNGEVLQTDYDAGDVSMRVISCHSRLRELQVVKDHVLMLLEKYRDMELRDIVIMAPDIQLYAPYIKAIFSDIPHAVADRSLFRRNVYVALFSEFLELCSGRFGWSDVLELLGKEQIAPQFGLSADDCEHLKNWVIGAGVRWGLSESSRARFGLAFRENSWRAGLDRLLLGYASAGDTQVAGILPYVDIEGGAALAMGGLCDFIDLLEKAETDLAREQTLAQWGQMLRGYAEALFGRSEQVDYLDLEALLRQLEGYGTFHHEVVDSLTIVNWFASSTRDSRSASGFLRGQLTFCSMLPMRSIPFRGVCLIGMNNGEFPKNESRTPFNLMTARHMPGDRSVRSDDRYQFLEALLAARDSLYISFQGRSLKTNEKMPPSVVVSELLEVLATMAATDEGSVEPENFIEDHPLHNFSSRYFAADGELFSYDGRACRVAEIMRSSQQDTRPWWSGDLEEDITKIELPELFSFYRDPQKYFIERILGIDLVQPEAGIGETEPFALGGLERYLVDHELIEHIGQKKDPAVFLERVRQEGRWPLRAAGDIIFADRERELRSFVEQIDGLCKGQRCPDISVDLGVGRFRLVGVLSHVYENGLLLYRYGKLRGEDLLAGWLHHALSQAVGLSLQTDIVTGDAQITFEGEMKEGPGLSELLDVYVRGCRKPSSLFPGLALDYCRYLSGRALKTLPLEKVRTTFVEMLEKGYKPAWEILYRNDDVRAVLADEFETMAEKFLLPLWERR